MKKILIIIIIILLSFFVWKQYRYYYKVGNVEFTVWKTTTGHCYITPYIYIGIFPPKDNFIKVSNVSQISIYIKNDTSLVLFNIEDEIECHFTKFECTYLSCPPPMGWKKQSDISEKELEEYLKKKKKWEEKWEICENSMSGISLDIRHMNVSTKSLSEINSPNRN